MHFSSASTTQKLVLKRVSQLALVTEFLENKNLATEKNYRELNQLLLQFNTKSLNEHNTDTSFKIRKEKDYVLVHTKSDPDQALMATENSMALGRFTRLTLQNTDNLIVLTNGTRHQKDENGNITTETGEFETETLDETSTKNTGQNYQTYLSKGELTYNSKFVINTTFNAPQQGVLQPIPNTKFGQVELIGAIGLTKADGYIKASTQPNTLEIQGKTYITSGKLTIENENQITGQDCIIQENPDDRRDIAIEKITKTDDGATTLHLCQNISNNSTKKWEYETTKPTAYLFNPDTFSIGFDNITIEIKDNILQNNNKNNPIQYLGLNNKDGKTIFFGKFKNLHHQQFTTQANNTYTEGLEFSINETGEIENISGTIHLNYDFHTIQEQGQFKLTPEGCLVLDNGTRTIQTKPASIWQPLSQTIEYCINSSQQEKHPHLNIATDNHQYNAPHELYKKTIDLINKLQSIKNKNPEFSENINLYCQTLQATEKPETIKTNAEELFTELQEWAHNQQYTQLKSAIQTCLKKDVGDLIIRALKEMHTAIQKQNHEDFKKAKKDISLKLHPDKIHLHVNEEYSKFRKNNPTELNPEVLADAIKTINASEWETKEGLISLQAFLPTDFYEVIELLEAFVQETGENGSSNINNNPTNTNHASSSRI